MEEVTLSPLHRATSFESRASSDPNASVTSEPSSSLGCSSVDGGVSLFDVAAHRQEAHHIAEVKNLPEFKVNTLFWKRAFRVLFLGIASPVRFPLIWILFFVNIAAQVVGGYVAQMHFYYTATGHGTSDPGMAGCLGKGCGYRFAMVNATLIPKIIQSVVNGTFVNVTAMVPVNSTMKAKLIHPPGDRDILEGYMCKFAWLFFILVGCVVAFSVTGDVINVFLRRRAGRKLHRRLLNANTLYRLTLDGRVDNFDQRITSDLQVLLDGLCSCLFGNTADYLAYPIGFCLSRLGFAFYNTLSGLPNPSKGILIVVVAFTLATISLLAYVIPMNQISRIFYINQMYEGDFRYTHTRTVVFSESISLYRGEGREMAHADRRFKRYYYNARRYYIWQGLLMILRLIVTKCEPSFCYLALSLSGANNASYASAFIKQMGDVMEYLDNLPIIIARLAFTAGAAHRVGQLMEVVDELQHRIGGEIAAQPSPDFIELVDVVAGPPAFEEYKQSQGPPWFVRLFKFCFRWRKRRTSGGEISLLETPEIPREPLFKNLSLRIERGTSVVIMGPSGCGKSSLLRIIGGLWPVTSGLVYRPSATGPDGIFFLPQRPYVFYGSLADQLTYTNPSQAKHLGEYKALLAQVGLSHLENKLNGQEQYDWSTLLSTSEQQRLSFARLFHQKPMFVLMDESTSAMDLHMEFRCLHRCTELGITMITVAHRPTVIPHHQMVFSCDSDSKTWSLRQVSESEGVSLGATTDDDPIQVIPLQQESSFGASDSGSSREPGGLGMLFLRRFFRALGLATPRKLFNKPLFCIFLACACMGLYGMLQIIIFKSFGTSGIINKVIAGNTGSAMNDALIQIGINVAGCVLMSISAFAGAMFGLYVHRAIIKKFHHEYFSPKVPYLLNRVDRSLTDVDQRMVQDLGAFRESLAWIFGNPFAFFNFQNGLLPQLIALIVMVAYAFTLNWTLITFFLIVLLAAIMCQILASMVTSKAAEVRNGAEAQLRMHYGRLRNFIEPITFFHGQDDELVRAEKLLDLTIKKRMRYVLLAALSTWPTVSMYYWLQNGDYMMAAIVQLYLSFAPSNPAEIYTLIAFCIVIGKLVVVMVMGAGGIGMLAGTTHRVMIASEHVEGVYQKSMNMGHPSKGDKIALSNVTIGTPALAATDGGGAPVNPHEVAVEEVESGRSLPTEGTRGRTLIHDLSLSVSQGKSMVIMGPSGCGKSSSLRTLAGLQIPISGLVIVPSKEHVFQMPQVSYATEGTLREQIIYPLDNCAICDEEILKVLDDVSLLHLVRRWGLNNSVPWDDVLSGGEMQRLGFARLFLRKPLFAILDESTSALDIPLEERMLSRCAQYDITLLSVATRPSVIRFHDLITRIDRQGGAVTSSVEYDTHLGHNDGNAGTHGQGGTDGTPSVGLAVSPVLNRGPDTSPASVSMRSVLFVHPEDQPQQPLDAVRDVHIGGDEVIVVGQRVIYPQGSPAEGNPGEAKNEPEVFHL